MSISFEATCPICGFRRRFSPADDYYSCRDLQSEQCEKGGCVTRERAMAKALFSLYSENALKELAIHESSPMPRGLCLWLRENCPLYVMSGYFEGRESGSMVNGLHHQDLEAQTFGDGVFDIVLHCDVMEHLFYPFQALAEIWRTLKHGGRCLFTVPTVPDRFKSEQVAFMEGDEVRIVGEPEYHGNPQNGGGSLVTWRYGYDLPYQISRRVEFDVEVRRWYSKSDAILGHMTEVYILSKP